MDIKSSSVVSHMHAGVERTALASHMALIELSNKLFELMLDVLVCEYAMSVCVMCNAD